MYQTMVDSWPVLISATWVTLKVSFWAILLGQLLGLPLAIVRVSGPRWAQLLIDIYVSFFRGVPLLVKILLIYYFLPALGINVPPVMSAVIALGMASSAYVEEIYRATISGISKGQYEAAAMLQFDRLTTWRRIIFPQALRSAVPALANEVITLIKASALVSVVGVMELTSATESMASQNFQPMQMYLMAAVLYLLITSIVSLAASYLERRLQVGLS